MLTRRQELNTQLQQLIDAVLLALSLLAARTLRYYGTSWFDPSKSIDPFQDYQWLLIVVMPFGPILLDMQGFYQSPLTKTKWKSFMQIVRAMIGLSIIVSGCVIFLRLPLASRSVPLLSILIATLALLLKERVIINYIRKRAIRGELREHILLAGLPEDMANLERSFTPEQQLLMNVAGRIDIDKQPLSDLVEAMHPVGNPPDIVLRRHDFEVGKPLEHPAVHHPRKALLDDVDHVNLQIRGGRHRRRERHPGH